MRFPHPGLLHEHTPSLVRLVATTSWLPHPDTVRQLGRAVFPTTRYRNGKLRFAHILRDGEPVGMYDDNATPEWALIWPHEIVGARPQGWTIAHVWADGDELDSYTHPANLLMVPESLAGLTDKTGPLTSYLRWHAWKVYGWKAANAPEPKEPADFADVAWRYLPHAPNPWARICGRMQKLDNQRVSILRPLMKYPD